VQLRVVPFKCPCCCGYGFTCFPLSLDCCFMVLCCCLLHAVCCIVLLLVPGVEVILNMPDNSFDWQGVKHQIGPTTLQMDQSKIRHCKACRGCQQHLTPMPKGRCCRASARGCQQEVSAGGVTSLLSRLLSIPIVSENNLIPLAAGGVSMYHTVACGLAPVNSSWPLSMCACRYPLAGCIIPSRPGCL